MKRSISDAIRMTVIFKEALPDDGPNQIESMIEDWRKIERAMSKLALDYCNGESKLNEDEYLAEMKRWALALSAILKPIGRVEWQDDPRGTITKLIVHGENDQRELYPLE